MIEPLPPSASSKIVAGYIETIQPNYFLIQPPVCGMRIQALGVDGDWSTWDVNANVFNRLISALLGDLAIRQVRTHPYVMQEVM